MNTTGPHVAVPFDEAVDYYDETRGLSPEASAATTELLVAEFARSRRLLEVGVGTGLLATPLIERGFRVDGIDLSQPMMMRLREKVRPPARLGLAAADARRLPFRDDSFDGAFIRHVLHLIPDWHRALEEVTRVVRPGGKFLISITDYTGLYREMQERFLAEAGLSLGPGLHPDDHRSLLRAMSRWESRGRRLPTVRGRRTLTLRQFLEHIEQGHYTWTWSATKKQRTAGVTSLRAWLHRRFASLDHPVEPHYAVEWWAFDLPRHPGRWPAPA